MDRRSACFGRIFVEQKFFPSRAAAEFLALSFASEAGWSRAWGNASFCLSLLIRLNDKLCGWEAGRSQAPRPDRER
jgi:hypothetical protein